jgi:hypothetical protein
LVPLFQRGRITKMGSRRNLSPSVERKSAFFDSPLWKRGARGDFVLKPRD